MASFLAEAQPALASKLKYNHEKYAVERGGQFENQQRAQARLALIIPAALGLIFLLLYTEFGQARHVAVILLTVPLALLGGWRRSTAGA